MAKKQKKVATGVAFFVLFIRFNAPFYGKLTTPSWDRFLLIIRPY
ncbi:MAG: hypothetical protein ACKVOU_12145 [Cytophagales bacterium]